jgi:HSP20 family protein
MTVKGTKELVPTERSRYLTPIDEMERWFENAWRRPFSLLGTSLWPELKIADVDEFSPSVDIYEDGNYLVFKADLPGIKKDDIEINLHENVLTLTGRKEKEEKVEKDTYYRYERSRGSFFRRFELPGDVDTDKIKAHYEDGVLEIRLPKSEEAKKKSKKISIS